MAAAGETSDGSVRQNDRTTKILLDDMNNEESVKQAETISAPEEEQRSHSLETEVLGEDHSEYKKNLKNLMGDVESNESLVHLESAPFN